MELEALDVFGIFPTDPSALRAAVPAATGIDEYSLDLYRRIEQPG